MVLAVKHRCTFFLEGLDSLKEKRSYVRRAKTILEKEFHCCSCESHSQDDHERIGLTLVFLSSSRDHAIGLCQKVNRVLEDLLQANLEEENTEML
ncbi:MAG TPA: DUF503 family protein [Thermotogota bacterium]|nr:DUF503 family protein [Thermotogota bacterium]HRW93523.1 DUF503 family protein [Thermotogota bacterium]